MHISCSDATLYRTSSTPKHCYLARVLLLGDALEFWVVVKMLLTLFGRIMGVLIAQVACSPPFFVDPIFLLACSLGGGGLAMEARLAWWWLLVSFPILGVFVVFQLALFRVYLFI